MQFDDLLITCVTGGSKGNINHSLNSMFMHHVLLTLVYGNQLMAMGLVLTLIASVFFLFVFMMDTSMQVRQVLMGSPFLKEHV